MEVEAREMSRLAANTAFIALPASISSPLSLYLDPLPAALGFLQRAVATGPIWPGPR